MGDQIEFHTDGAAIAFATSSHAPDRGDLVNIRKETWKVIGRTYTLDYADEPRSRSMVCIINLARPEAAATSDPARHYHNAEIALMGQRWTATEADKLIFLVEAGRRS